jgi:hypothetical protein
VPVAFYMDVHIPRAITLGLRLSGVDVITAQEDGAILFSDPALLDRASILNRVLFTFDDDLLIEATRRQRENLSFSGVVFARALGISIGECIRDLELVAKAMDLEDFLNKVEYLPL